MICAYIFVYFVYNCLIRRDLQNIVEGIKFSPMVLFDLKINYLYDIPVCIPRVHGRRGDCNTPLRHRFNFLIAVFRVFKPGSLNVS